MSAHIPRHPTPSSPRMPRKPRNKAHDPSFEGGPAPPAFGSVHASDMPHTVRFASRRDGSAPLWRPEHMTLYAPSWHSVAYRQAVAPCRIKRLLLALCLALECGGRG